MATIQALLGDLHAVLERHDAYLIPAGTPGCVHVQHGDVRYLVRIDPNGRLLVVESAREPPVLAERFQVRVALPVAFSAVEKALLATGSNAARAARIALKSQTASVERAESFILAEGINAHDAGLLAREMAGHCTKVSVEPYDPPTADSK